MLSSRLASLSLTISLLAGCALSPQTVSINPQIDLAEINQQGDKQNLSLQIADDRGTRIVGTRGGVYPETSEISTGEDIKTPIRNVLTKALRDMGYNVVGESEQSSATFKVIVDSLSYKTESENVMKAIETAASIRVVAIKGNREYTGRYRGKRTTEVLKAPNEERNAEMINAALSHVLQRLLDDSELHQFLRG